MDTTTKSYYLRFGINELLSSREILKSMPVVYNNLYYTTEYATALWDGEGDATFENVIVLCDVSLIDKIRQIIRNNFLYVPKWDSIRFTDNEDYGFTFIVGRVKYILGTFSKTNKGYHIKLFDVNTGICTDTDLPDNNDSFLNSSLNDSGEFIRTCQFDVKYMTDENTKKKYARKKDELEVATVDTKGYAMVNAILLTVIAAASIVAVVLAYYAVA